MGELQRRQVNRNKEQKRARTHEALDLRLKGKTYKEIGEGLGVATETARLWVKAALEEAARHTMDLALELRELEHQRLTRVFSKLEQQLETLDLSLEIEAEAYMRNAEQAAHEGKLLIYQPNPMMLKERRMTLEALVKVSESLRKLYGLDAPIEVKVTSDRAPSFGDEVKGATLKERFNALHARIRESQKGGGKP